MCGIAGQVRADGAAVEERLIARMCAAQEHRGPDSRGVHASGPVGLGIQRLRVIDLDTGDQPVYNEDGTIAVVLNGEIYNFAKLRQELQQRGHTLVTDGDTEVIAHLYEEYGTACLSRLEGMFSFALWDARRRRLFVARDRVGKKPLFYSLSDGVLSFASELQALLQAPEVSREIDPEAIDAYLALGYIPAPLSAFRDVRKLPPAHLLVYQDGSLTIERYWKLDYSVKIADSADDMDERIRASLRSAVAKRLTSDVPLGAFLSGGIDSSAVVAAMSEQSSLPVKTFSIGFPDESFNELPQARLVAERFATDHHELVLEPDATALLPKLVRHYGEPFGDHSALPSFYLAELAREHVTVALNGDGGDESFAGYQRYTSNVLAAKLDLLPGSLRRGISSAAARIGPDPDPGSLRSRAQRFARSLGSESHERYLRQISIFNGDERRELYAPEFARAVLPVADSDRFLTRPWREASGSSLLDQLLEVDATVYLPGDLLTKIDIATMASSLEARSPLLDHQFMELAASIPAAQKARGRQRKIALRRAMRGWLPDSILDGRKQGFQLPVSRWLRTDLAPFTREVLLDRQGAGRDWIRPAQVEALIDQHTTGTADHGDRLWSLLVLELWSDSIAREQPVEAVGPAAIDAAPLQGST